MTETVTGAPSAGPVHRQEDVKAMLARVGRAEARRQRRENHRNGRATAALLVAIWSSAAVSSLFLDDVPAPGYLVPLLGIASGLACLAIRWERISPSWLQIALAAATAEIAIWVALGDPSYGVLYVPVAAYAAYVSRRRREVAAQVALILVALAAPLLYDSDRAAVIGHAVLIMSVVATVSAMAAWVRGQVRARQRLYTHFAIEALQLAVRIRGDAVPRQPLEVAPEGWPAAHAGSAARSVSGGWQSSERVAAELEALASPRAAIAPRGARARVRMRRAVLTAGAAAVGMAVAIAGLAIAGLATPPPLRAPLDALTGGPSNQALVAPRAGSESERSTRGGDRSPIQSPSGKPRDTSTVSRAAAPTTRAKPPIAGDQGAPDGTAALDPAEGASPGGPAPTLGGAPTPSPGRAERSLGDASAVRFGFVPGGDAPGAPAVGADQRPARKLLPDVGSRPLPPRP